MAVNAHPYKHLVASGPLGLELLWVEDAAVAVSPEGSLPVDNWCPGQVGSSCLVLSCFFTETTCASAVFHCRVIPEGLSAGADGTAIDMSSVVDVHGSFSCEVQSCGFVPGCLGLGEGTRTQPFRGNSLSWGVLLRHSARLRA